MKCQRFSMAKCRAPSQNIRDGLPSAVSKGSCAVVGSADVLRLAPHGADIDNHTFVWRLNNAPTRGWETAVGTRTSIRIVNHVPIEKWILRATNRSALAATKDSFEHEHLLCDADAVEHGCLVSLQGAKRAFEASTFKQFQRLYPSHKVATLSRAMQAYGTHCNRELHGTAPSTGLLAVLLAVNICNSVSLYGFWPFCCQTHRGWPRMNYKCALPRVSLGACMLLVLIVCAAPSNSHASQILTRQSDTLGVLLDRPREDGE